MKEKGKIFNTEDVKAILENRKTMFRVPIKPQPPEDSIVCYDSIDKYQGEGWFFQYLEKVSSGITMNKKHYLSNNGQPLLGSVGDKIYVKETFAVYGDDKQCVLHYKSTRQVEGSGWKSPLTMPKKYSRIWLEITDIRVEKVGSASQEDAEKEGYVYQGWSPSYSDPDSGGDGEMNTPLDQFFENWEKFHGKENQWVFVYEFKKVETGE